MQVTTVGIDLAKNVFCLHGCDTNGKPLLRKQLARRQLLGFLANLPRCLVAMEACASAHYWAREIEQIGHQVRLISPRFVKPYVKTNKNDASDAEAICEAAGRPPIPAELRQLIRKMARENASWGEERIANELLLKLGLRVSPRTVRKYMPKSPPATGIPRGDQRWATFLKNHARGIIACDFCVAVTATFRILYVFVVIEHASRRLIHLNVTAHPTAAWTLQQLRDAIPLDHEYRFIIHDHDAIFSAELDASLTRLGLKVITTPVRSPQANSLCERLIGTLRRECLDWIIPLSEG